MELARVLSELLKLLLGTSGLGDLEHTEGRCLTLGPALPRGDDVASLHTPETGTGAQTHSHGGTIRMDGPEMMLTDGSGPLHLHLNHHIL